MLDDQGILICEKSPVCGVYKTANANETEACCNSPECLLEFTNWIEARIDRAATPGCWTWAGGCAGSPIVKFKGGKQLSAARIIRRLSGLPVTNGCQLSKTCSNPRCVNPDHHLDDWERFETYLIPLIDGCVMWIGALQDDGYAFGSLGGKKGRISRLLWQRLRGPIPEKMLCCHTCDRPFCVNLDHIFIGSVKDNSDDMVAKGRQGIWTPPEGGMLKGKEHPRAVLTVEIVNRAKSLARRRARLF